ncbi:Receptor-like protein 12 [Morella rubra]|uniref:Receptor-like protein 12 n=1 Tax=Morella rubra TaxID=262757 RepID=A0A6A1UGX9_9ROSI|nr:Receptor-like protein 12 [Morella rubra]
MIIRTQPCCNSRKISSLTSLLLVILWLIPRLPLGNQEPIIAIVAYGMGSSAMQIQVISLFRLVHLEILNLANNHFNYSQIPSQLNKLSLTILAGNLTHLQELNLSRVNISSIVPNLLGNASSLRLLYLRGCGLRGDFPIVIFKLPNLQALNVSCNAYLTGYFPDSIGNLQSLTQLKLSCCNFSGSIPSSIGNLARLSVLVLWRNQLIGLIPSSIENLTGLSVLDLGTNQLTCPIPSSFGNLTQLNALYLNNNHLTGPIPSSIGNLIKLNSLFLGNNQLTGPILSSFGNLTQLNALYLDDSHLTGPIPSSIGNLIKLNSLFLGNNQLTGPISSSIWNIIQLKVMFLGHNQLTGPIPSSIENFTQLRHLDFSNCNTFVDFVHVFKLNNLSFLTLSGNQVSFEERLSNATLPRVYLSVLDLRRNNLQVSIPENWTKGKRLKIINFSYNQFKRGVPRSLVNCKMLEILDLSNNQVRDMFPSWLGNLPNLKILSLKANKFYAYKFPSLQIIDHSKNNFVGKLPLELLGNRKLTYLTFLGFFNVSHNHLMGPIPQGKQFDTFENSSFEKNSGLCGISLTKKCDDSYASTLPPVNTHDSTGSLFEFGWRIVLLGYGFGLVVGMTTGHILIARKSEWLMRTFSVRQL